MIELDINQKDYPELLRNIKNPPKKLYILGNIDNLKKTKISIIGSRAASQMGMKRAKEFSKELASNGICIVSGMAKGIDSAAHWGSLLEKGRTIAVLASGFNNIYPRENKFLYDEILANKGCIISEYKPDEKPESYKFIQRNRIVSGLSRGVLVVEAAYRSGTSITAKFATQQNRKVYCLPHNIEETNGVGTNRLIKNGAILVTKPEEILKELNIVKNSKSIKQEQVEYSKSNISFENMDNETKEIFRTLAKEELTVNQLALKLNKDISVINILITKMELDGLIIQESDRVKINI